MNPSSIPNESSNFLGLRIASEEKLPTGARILALDMTAALQYFVDSYGRAPVEELADDFMGLDQTNGFEFVVSRAYDAKGISYLEPEPQNVIDHVLVILQAEYKVCCENACTLIPKEKWPAFLEKAKTQLSKPQSMLTMTVVNTYPDGTQTHQQQKTTMDSAHFTLAYCTALLVPELDTP